MATQALNKAAQNQPLNPPCFTKGQKVWLDAKNLTLPYRLIKLVPRWHGPFKIEEVRSPVVYQLNLPPQWTIHPISHTSLLMPYVETNEHGINYMRPPPDMIKGEEQYEVKVIRAHRYQNHKLQYLIKWRGYLESDNTWELVENVQAPLLTQEYHEAHLLEDKRTTRQASKISSLTQPTWLIESDSQNTFNSADRATASLAAAATAPTHKATSTAGLSTLTLEPPPQNPYTSLTSLLETSFATLPSIPHINSSSSAHLHYPIFVPWFAKDTSTCCSPPSATSRTPTASNTSTFAMTLAALLTQHTRCPACSRLNRPAARHPTRQMSQAPQNPQPLRKLHRIQRLPPSHSPLSPPTKMARKTKNPSPASLMLPPRQAAKLSRYGCDPSWFCSLHDTCFIHKLCLCEGSSRWPPVKPVRSSWVSMSREWLADLLSCQLSPPSSP
jgi:hypothetical protein